MKQDRRLTVKGAAEFLGVAPNTIRNWDRDGVLPADRHPTNHYRLFKPQDLQRLLRAITTSGVYPTGRVRPQRRSRPR